MSTPMAVSQFTVKPLDTPDERRTPEKTQVDVVHLDGVALGRFTFAPVWRWSACIKPVVGTASCQLSHAGYAVAGQLRIRLGASHPRRGRLCHPTQP